MLPVCSFLEGIHKHQNNQTWNCFTGQLHFPASMLHCTRQSLLKQRLTFFTPIHVSLHFRTEIPSCRPLSAVVQRKKNWQTPRSTQEDFNLTLEVILTKCCFPGTNFLIDWLIDSTSIHHLGLWLFNVSDVLCIYLFRGNVFKICMISNSLHVLSLL